MQVFSPIVQACLRGDRKELESLLLQGVSPARDPSSQVSPLFAAAFRGHYSCLSLLLDQPGLSVDDGDADGRSPLYVACLNRHRQCAELLAARGANLATGGGSAGGGALHAACFSREPETARVLLGMLSPSDIAILLGVRDSLGRTPLHVAAEGNADKCAALLIRHGADCNARDNAKRTPLHYATAHGAEDVLDVLTSCASTDLSARDAAGNTPLHLAAAYRETVCVEMLAGEPSLRPRLDIDAGNAAGNTALQFAALADDLIALRMLVEAGADVMKRDAKGRSALHLVCFSGRLSTVSVLEERHGADCNAEDSIGRRPLHYAAAGKREEIMTWLLNHGADYKEADNERKRTALHWAATHGLCSAVDELVARYADEGCFMPLDKDKRSPLHLAALHGSYGCVEPLLDITEDINAKDRFGMTALFLAAANGNTDTAELLISHGADPLLASDNSLLPLHIAAYHGHENTVALLTNAMKSVTDQKTLTDKHGRTAYHFAASGKSLQCLRALAAGKAPLLTAVDENGSTVLHYAAGKTDSEDLVSWILDQTELIDSSFINAQDKNGETALFKAIIAGNTESVASLLECKADTEICDKQGRTVLHAAAKYGNVEIMDMLIKETGIESLSATDNEGYVPLHYSISAEDPELSLLLLDASIDDSSDGEDDLYYNGHEDEDEFDENGKEKPVNPILRAFVNKASKSGITPLHITAQVDDVELGEHFIRLGADIRAKTSEGLTPLMYAVSDKKVKFAQMLLEKDKEQINFQDNEGRTALHWACHSTSPSVVDILLKCGADPTIRDKHNETPLFTAIASEKEQIVKYLLDHNIPVEKTGYMNRTPLHIACSIGSLYLMDVFLRMRFNPNCRTLDGRTPLHFAASRGHSHLFERLITSGAEIDAQDAFGWTPLMTAVSSDDALAVVFLIGMNANRDIPDVTGAKPIDLARKKGFKHCEELIAGKKNNFTFICQAKALFDFRARSAKELSITTGRIVNVLWKHHSGWWRGECDGQVGLFPGNYTSEIPCSAPKPVSDTDGNEGTTTSAAAETTTKEQKDQTVAETSDNEMSVSENVDGSTISEPPSESLSPSGIEDAVISEGFSDDDSLSADTEKPHLEPSPIVEIPLTTKPEESVPQQQQQQEPIHDEQPTQEVHNEEPTQEEQTRIDVEEDDEDELVVQTPEPLPANEVTQIETEQVSPEIGAMEPEVESSPPSDDDNKDLDGSNISRDAEGTIFLLPDKPEPTLSPIVDETEKARPLLGDGDDDLVQYVIPSGCSVSRDSPDYYFWSVASLCCIQ